MKELILYSFLIIHLLYVKTGSGNLSDGLPKQYWGINELMKV